MVPSMKASDEPRIVVASTHGRAAAAQGRVAGPARTTPSSHGWLPITWSARPPWSAEAPETAADAGERERDEHQRPEPDARRQELRRPGVEDRRPEGRERERAHRLAQHEGHGERREANRRQPGAPVEGCQDAERVRGREADHHGSQAIDVRLEAPEALAEVAAEPGASRPPGEPELHAAGERDPAAPEDGAEQRPEAEPTRRQDEPRRDGEELPERDEPEEDGRPVATEILDGLPDAVRRELDAEGATDHVADHQSPGQDREDRDHEVLRPRGVWLGHGANEPTWTARAVNWSTGAW